MHTDLRGWFLLFLPADAHCNNDRLPSRFQDSGKRRALLGNGHPKRDHDNEAYADER